MEQPPTPPERSSNPTEFEDLKKTTRISLDEVLSAPTGAKKITTRIGAPPAAKKATTALVGIASPADKKSTGIISGILTHTSPIPQTIRLKRPSTSPIVINPADLSSAPTVAKTMHPKPATTPISEPATVIKRPVPSRTLGETSRIIIEVDQQAAETRRKTSPIPAVSPIEPTPPPKTIRLKRPSSVVSGEESGIAAEQAGIQAAKKSETAKIDLKDVGATTPATQHKTIKIKRTDRNIISRPAAQQRPPAAPLAETIVREGPAPLASEDEENTPVFSILAAAAAVCLLLLAYLLAAQSFGPAIALPVPAALF